LNLRNTGRYQKKSPIGGANRVRARELDPEKRKKKGSPYRQQWPLLGIAKHQSSFRWRERRVYYWGDVGNGLIRTRWGLAFALSRSEQNLEPVGEEETVYRAFDGFAPNFGCRSVFPLQLVKRRSLDNIF
jgi:hypothetical protein